MLNVATNATQAEIKKAFELRSRKYLPENNQFASAPAKLEELKRAFAILGRRRAEYDRIRARAVRSGSTSSTAPNQNETEGGTSTGAGDTNDKATAAADLTLFDRVHFERAWTKRHRHVQSNCNFFLN